MVLGMDMEKTIATLISARRKYGREWFLDCLAKAGVCETTFWHWEKRYGKIIKGKLVSGSPNFNCVKRLSLVVAEEIAKLPVLQWHEGSPSWLIDDESPRLKSVKSEYSELRTTAEEIVTVVASWIEEPATRNEPSSIRNEGWAIFISHEEIDSGEGDERDVISALDRILENLHITLEK